MDTLGDTSLPSSPPGSATDIRASYDDLRRVNRAEHEKKRYESQSRPFQPAPSEPVTQPQEPPKPRKSYLRGCSALQLVVCSDIFSVLEPSLLESLCISAPNQMSPKMQK